MKLFSIFYFSVFLSMAHAQQNQSYAPLDKTLLQALKPMRLFPIQQGGRLKPLDTFARDTILHISEKRTLRGEYSSMEPLEVLLRWINNGEEWSKKKFIYVGHKDAKEKLGLDIKQNVFSITEIANGQHVPGVMQSIQQKQRQGIKLSPTEQNVVRAINKIEIYHLIATGKAWTMIPQNNHWTNLTEEPAKQTGIPQAMGILLDALFVSQTGIAEREAAVKNALGEIAQRQAVSMLQNKESIKTEDDQVMDLKDLSTKLQREVVYNKARLFFWAWVIYLFAVILFASSYALKESKGKAPLILKKTAWGFFISGFVVHSLGFLLRCLVTGRPPVTNMYESTIWVPWGVVLFSMIISFFNRKNQRVGSVAISAAVVATLSLILSDSVPAVLDPTIKPLEPVLRSNYWLTIHVLTITLSYGAFALSMGIGNYVLWLYLTKPKLTESIGQYATFMYRAVQFGVVLLAAGTILGGVWADYSWGRFWGWDPKETWALIALLMYIIILHGKWAGWLRQFGITMGTVLCFMGVLMAWYGVNFVLGVGLHSYGFSSGGLEFIAVYIVLQLIFVIAVAFKSRLKTLIWIKK